ncbi:hypothetical protein BATDEDRAFT_91130 [Batrachochytrium dendrobatidis JAM81]|uniref:STEEP1 domain-containing protein n=2 Tax=Batrachochytrium dendrobatidis TaxID=109871 RepID=F4P9X0_BATDJ|nr:uncharacterized protein BATDEDRAFT_91130 [Batrachochytrium dendrobatidis JAM81]EGF77882.1 hypothetical protein BATDEDRAFT_91130 [Batrachochytrium dendrobatidis JAM81]KAJ8330122.1 STING ER exit protein [Batrachochytrium dendrobatidis]KAK5670459.1 STING ER exit protein [Batrachochytrium dendrobatidis]OAJ44096.1 hypothetical protein BDEG_27367 [Batrachochytrium dendrobatidis JEL423]|eukprot:XP_006681499.1 hypothetical protein BATDEDRAFT_91130 [Batrachochytrium dendrobatidis JAM81]
MPKVVSRGVVSEYDPDNDKDGLNVYYCSFCGEYVLILDTLIEKVPQRKTDKAYILDEDQRVVRFHTVPGNTILIQRSTAFERQQRQNCPGCGLTVCYTPNDSSKYVYVLDGALTLQRK